MAEEQKLVNRLRAHRIAKGWSQDDLASRAGISRAGVSAIEVERLVPSTATALALAAALGCRVEQLFQLGSCPSQEPAWAWPPSRQLCRYWRASVAGREFLYPSEATHLGVIGHDGHYDQGRLREQAQASASATLVIASCDPAIALLAGHFSRRSGFRMIAFPRPSKQALGLLAAGLVHAAGVHYSKARQEDENANAALEHLHSDFRLLRIARWQEGLAVGAGIRVNSVDSALRRRGRWIGREAGSAARKLLDELLDGRRAPRHVAYGHRGVAEAVRSGLADFGVCLRLVVDEVGLDFLPVQQEEYDLCFPAEWEGDPRIQALVETARSPEYRAALGDLPGYDSSQTGEIERIASHFTASSPYNGMNL
jgi:molybdate-binding protein/DNA-binding XRE family transcriptional regulator